MTNSTETVETIFGVSGIQILHEVLQLHQGEHERLRSEANRLSAFMTSVENRDVTPITTFSHTDFMDHEK